ncbi:MAG: hypothetical protein HY017_17070 [Betaproteobacteria bacterium]|nr:hypothetical protein [Betaproteobacteria bacterium]
MSKASYSRLKIPLPPLEIQRKIVAELDRCRRVMEDAGDVIANYASKIQAKLAEIWGEDQRDQPIS